MPKVKIVSGDYHGPRNEEKTFALRGGFSGMGAERSRVNATSHVNASNTRTVLYVVAIQAATNLIKEFVRLRGMGREHDAVRVARSRHSKFYPAQVVGMRICD